MSSSPAPEVTSASPVESSPVESSPVESSPVESSPVEPSPVESSPVESSPVESSPVESSPVESSPVESSPVESSPVAAATAVESSPAALVLAGMTTSAAEEKKVEVPTDQTPEEPDQSNTENSVAESPSSKANNYSKINDSITVDDLEDVLMELNSCEKLMNKDTSVEIPDLLENYIKFVAHSGCTHFPWIKVKWLFRAKLDQVIGDYFNSSPIDDIPAAPNVDMFNFASVKDKVFEQLDSFAGIPFTIQRIAELLTSPKRHYRRTDKFMRALEKNMLVVSSVEARSQSKETTFTNGDHSMSEALSISSSKAPQWATAATTCDDRQALLTSPESRRPSIEEEDMPSTSQEPSPNKRTRLNEQNEEVNDNTCASSDKEATNSIEPDAMQEVPGQSENPSQQADQLKATVDSLVPECAESAVDSCEQAESSETVKTEPLEARESAESVEPTESGEPAESLAQADVKAQVADSKENEGPCDSVPKDTAAEETPKEAAGNSESDNGEVVDSAEAEVVKVASKKAPSADDVSGPDAMEVDNECSSSDSNIQIQN